MSRELCDIITEIETKSVLDETGKEIGVKRTVLTSSTHQIIKKRRDDMFFHIFRESALFSIMLSLKGRAAIVTFLALAAKTKFYNNKDWTDHHHLGNVVMVNSKILDEIHKEGHIKSSAVKAALRTLVEKKLLLRDDPVRKGVYYFNPELMFNGATSTRTKVLNNLRDDSYTIEVEE